MLLLAWGRGHRIMGIGQWARGRGHGTVGTGLWTQDNGHGTVGTGPWAQDNGHGAVGTWLSSSAGFQHSSVTFQWPQLEALSGEEERPLFPVHKAFFLNGYEEPPSYPWPTHPSVPISLVAPIAHTPGAAF